ncbi:MAG: hypothetical protein QF733_07700 [Phycisphaerales bacterium]|nr:hypothetical protein [Phycisphaerales bacterium]
MRGPAVPLGIVAAIMLGMLATSPRTAVGVLDERSEYVAVTASSGRGAEDIVWLLDTRTEELIAVAWDREARRMAPLGRRSVAADVETARRGR